MDSTYAAIGRAVFYAQVFETSLVPIFEFFKMLSDPAYFDKTGGFISAGAFKNATSNVVKELAKHEKIAPELEARLSAFIEDRHVLIHRWIQQNGLPEESPEAFVPYVEHANRVEEEAKALSRIFLGYMLKYANPEWAKDHLEEYKVKISQMFHQAHIDGGSHVNEHASSIL